MPEPDPTGEPGMAGACPFRLPNPFEADYVRDPFPALARARREAPVARVEGLDLWAVTRYEDIREVLRDPQTFSNANAQKSVYPMCAEAMQVLKDGGFDPQPFTAVDPPVHTRMRKAFTRAVSFTPARIDALRPWIERRARVLIDAFAGRGHADLCAELTTPLPAAVIFHLIGFPEADTPKLLDWCHTRLRMSFGIVAPEEQVATAEHMVSYWRYCVDFVERCRSHPGDNITTALLGIHAEDASAVSTKEISSFLYGLIIAGHETTNHAIASALRLLLERREHWDALGADRTRIPRAFEEALRLEPPIVAWRRITTRETELGGVALPAGAELLLHLGSSGHDEAVFADPDELSLARENSGSHLAFGHGIHFCIGAPLARAEGEIALNLLVDRFPDLALVRGQDYRYLPNLVIRGPARLLVQWTPRH
jgi:cytochrome P450